MLVNMRLPSRVLAAQRCLRIESLERRLLLDAALPDLISWAGPSAGLYDVYIEQSGGQDLLRFGNAIANIGSGPLALFWGPPSGDGTQPGYQRVSNTDGTYTDHLVGDFEYHPTHNHTHLEGFALYNLRAVNPDGTPGAVLSGGDKTSFCVEDTRAYDAGLPGAPGSAVYSCSVQGISVGWADVYDHYLDGQYIDVTSFSTGDYWLESISNPDGVIIESNTDNNSASVLIHIDRENHTASVVGSSGIPADLYEDNDTMAITESHPPGASSPNFGVVTGTRTITDLTMEDGFDWYRFETNAAATAAHSVRIDFSHAQGDLDMNLRDAGGAILATSDSTGNFETISLASLPAAAYFVEVFGYQGAGNPGYTLTLEVPDATGGIVPDAMEDNDTQAIVNGRTAGDYSSPNLGQFTGQRTYTDLNMEDAADWYKFQAVSGATSGNLVRIDFAHAQGDLDMNLRDAGGAILEISESVSDVEEISLAGLPGGAYYVEVYGYNGATSPGYTLTIDVPAGSGGFAPDAYEDNDTQAIVDGRPVGAANSPNLGELTGTVAVTSLNMEDGFDWYKFQTSAPGTAADSVRIDFTHTLGDLDMRLRDAGGAILETAESETDAEAIGLASLPAATYYIEVYGDNGATNPNYTLTIDAPTGGGLTPDAYEDNDTQAIVDGRPVGAADSPNLGAVAGTRTINSLNMEDGFDWYKFETSEPGTAANSVRIDFTHTLGDLDMRLRDAGGAILETAESETDAETIGLASLPAGTYYVEVYGYNGATNPNYTLTIDAPATSGNAPPELAPVGDQTVVEGELLTFTAAATDPDQPPNALTFSLDAGAPAGASIDPFTGVFTWTPSGPQGPAAHSITVRVTDNGTPALDDWEEITVTVTAAPAGPSLRTGVVSGVDNSGWTPVTLDHTYTSMVVVATPNYSSTDVPVVTRVQNATGDSFEVRTDRTDGLTDAVAGVDVYYFVVEEGVYNLADHGVTMEAVKVNVSVTDHAGSWQGEQQSYGNAYTNPVVVGQVMSYNDPEFSVFWARGSSRRSAPSSSSLWVGKHVGEDTGRVDVDETIGYVVIEAGNGSIGSLGYSAGLGADTVRGVGNAPPYTYSLSGLTSPSTAVLSQAAMDGGNGGWAVLYGADPITETALSVAIDEDQAADAERNHTTEQVAYIVFEQLAAATATASEAVDQAVLDYSAASAYEQDDDDASETPGGGLSEALLVELAYGRLSSSIR